VYQKAMAVKFRDLKCDVMIAAVIDPERVYKDLVSGRKDDRPGLRACLNALKPANTLVVWKLDRLGRDFKHLINTVDDLNKRKIPNKQISNSMNIIML
jgi:DNA invertase Pin-like site-specific DNA recombinase